MDENKDKDAALTASAISNLTVLVTQLGGALVGIGAIAYLIGYNYLNSYYAHTGASWALSLYGSTDVIRAGSRISLAVALMGLLAIWWLLDGRLTPARLGKWATVLALLGIGTTLIAASIPRTLLPANVAA